MLNSLFLVLYCVRVSLAHEQHSDSADDLGEGLVASLRSDANLDLPLDEEYEDLRAQLLAYRSALSSLTASRRSMLTTPCWRHGGICINHKLCPGYRQRTEVPGCKNRLHVCCFVWNQYEVRELRDQGVDNLAFPWNINTEFGGQGIQIATARKPRKKKTKKVTEAARSVSKKTKKKLLKETVENFADFSNLDIT